MKIKMKCAYLCITIILFVFGVIGCSLIDKGRIPEQVNVKGIETSFARIGSTTTKYKIDVKKQKEMKVEELEWYKKPSVYIVFLLCFVITLQQIQIENLKRR